MIGKLYVLGIKKVHKFPRLMNEIFSEGAEVKKNNIKLIL